LYCCFTVFARLSHKSYITGDTNLFNWLITIKLKKMNQELSVLYWNEIRSKLKLKFPVLTNSDLHWRHTTQEDLLNMIAGKLGKTYKELVEIIDEL